MCGFLTAYDPNGSLDKNTLTKASLSLVHRGPDSFGQAFRNHNKIYMGHNRLKIIDIDNESNQPFISDCGRYALVFNGEIYNYLELRNEIGTRWNWKTKSDTEVLLAAWSLWKYESLKKLVGMFAFAIHDQLDNNIIIVRDRFGIKPIYYTKIKNTFIFSSEIPPLLKFVKPEPNLDIIRTYLSVGLYEHTEQTFFKNIKSLRPGSHLTLNLKTNLTKTEKWYDLINNIPNLDDCSEEELFYKCDDLIRASISSNLRADVEVGINFSGGVDSSMLVTTASSMGYRPKLFSQNYEGYSELEWIQQTSSGNDLFVSNLSAEKILSDLKETVISQAEPFGGVTVCGYNDLYKSARAQGVKVLLDGNGIDEAFLGYTKYTKILSEDKFNINEFQGLINGTSSIDGTIGILPEALGDQLFSADLVLNHDVDLDFSESVKRAAYKDLVSSKIPRGLRFNDRVSMANSCELRVPFLDHRLVEFGFGIPARFLINTSETKSLIRKLLAKNGFPSVAYAKKRSVQSPQREWLADDWRSFVSEIIYSKSFNERGWISPTVAKKSYNEYISGSKENSFFIWQWINLELWARHYFDGNNYI